MRVSKFSKSVNHLYISPWCHPIIIVDSCNMAVNDETEKIVLSEKTGVTPPRSPNLSDSSMDLLSQENLDRSSPELWPEQIPGVSKFASLSMPNCTEKTTQQPEWLKDFDHEDIHVLQGFGSLTAAALMEKVRDLQNLAYQLGLEEAKEMTRGRFLGILPKKKDIRR